MKNQLALALLLASTSSAAVAADISHTYVEVGFARQQVELPEIGNDVAMEDMKADGGYIRGSVELNDAFYLFGGYSKGNDDIDVRYYPIGKVFEVDADAEQGDIGFGYRHTLSDRVEWTGELSYVNTRISVGVDGFKDRVKGDDYRASVGLRSNLASNFEGWIKANYTDGDVYDGEFTGTLGALVKFNETWGIVGEAEIGSDNKQYRVGVRASF